MQPAGARAAIAAMALAACGKTPDPRIEVLSPPPLKSVEIQIDVAATGCTVTHQNGAHARDLRIPADTPTRLVLTSRDGDHDVSLGSPPLRQHVEPSVYEFAAIRVHAPATLPLECPDGVAADFEAVPYDDYVAYLVDLAKPATPQTPAEQLALGRSLYERKGCIECHALAGSSHAGLSLRGLWGATVALPDGTPRTVDAAYVRTWLVAPQVVARPGAPSTMPSYEGQLTEVELAALTAFIASLAATP
jgi:cytochrome c oxidase subunit 2|nr:c-type cytochrome [Kofleriaceae bacterium]